MEERTIVGTAILICSLLSPLSAESAPSNASNKPAGSRPAAAAVVPIPVPAPTASASGPATPATPATPASFAPAAPDSAPATPDSAPATPDSVSPPPGPTSKLPAPKTPLEVAFQQIVMLERAGRPIAIGSPLNGDGRIVTALSPLTHGNQIVARYPDGQLVPVKLSHSDRGWDLALLTPEGDVRRSGLKGSRDPAVAGTKLHTASYVGEKRLGSTDVTIKAKGVLRGCDSAELPEALELPSAPKAANLGAPLINDQGEVVAIIARACAVTDKVGCTLAPYGAPVTAVRDFLRSAPIRRSPWVGLDVVAFDAGVVRGVRVTAIAPEGPAASSGLRAGPTGVGDVVLAVDGTPVATSAAFASAIDNREPGTPARLTVLTEGQFRELVVKQPTSANTLAPARTDRVFQSNPAAPVPPTSAPNPYR